MSVNKFSKQQPDSSPSAASGYTFEPSDRLAWDMRNIRQFYHSRASNSTPSSSILNSPDLEYDRSVDHFQHFSDRTDKAAPDAGHDFLGVNVNFTNTLVSGLSPTSSHSSNSENIAEAKFRNIGGLQITNLRESPRRPGGSQSNGQTSRKSSTTSQEIPRVFMQSSSNRRAPGFPKRVVSEPSNEPEYHKKHEEDLQCHDNRRVHEEFFSHQQQQELHQQKLLEFQQRSKLQQVEKVLPLDDFANLDPGSTPSSASLIGQRLVALKQQQQKQHYEHLLQQQYENHNIFEDNEPSFFNQIYEAEILEDEQETRPNGASSYTNSFAMSPEPNDYDSNLDSLENSLKYVNPFCNIPMPVLEDGLSSEHGSDTENNNNLDSLSSPARASEAQNSSPSEQKSSPDPATRNNNHSTDEAESSVDATEVKVDDEPDTDHETDRLLGEQRMLEQHLGNIDANQNMRVLRCANGQIIKSPKSGFNKTDTVIRQGVGAQSNEPVSDGDDGYYPHDSSPSSTKSPKMPTIITEKKGLKRNTEGSMLDPSLLSDGVLFRARYLGTTQLVCEGRPTKSTRMMQAEEAVHRIKAPEGENQPSTDVDLFISTEKVMVLNTDIKEVMMDHTLKTISYIADIGDLVVLMARRRPQNSSSSVDENAKIFRSPKMICHIFESDEAQFIAQSIGQAFQVAYMEFLKANGIEDHSFMKEMDYQEVLNSQEIFGDELEIFAKKELQKEVVVPKAKGEILGVVIVESGWGSMLPTVVIANLASSGAAARCGHLNIGDQIIAINGLSLVGLPLTQCQAYVKNTKNQTAVKFTVVPCAPVVEVKIKRPNTKYQLGFSVQNGVICSLLRGGIAERGGVRVGHRIIEINNQSVVAVPHDKIVNLLATSVGEIIMKTMPTAMFRLLTGQENPLFI